MNEICKEYMADVKALLPVRGKINRKFIKNISADVNAFCEETGALTKEELYAGYGKPNEIVSNYILTLDDKAVAKQMNITRFMKIATAVLLILAVIATFATGLFMYGNHKLYLQDEETIKKFSAYKPVYVEKMNPGWSMDISEYEKWTNEN